MPHLPASQALARFRVVDLTQVREGPTACRQLADWGADVIQVQMPEHMRGDDTLGGQDGSDYQYTHRDERYHDKAGRSVNLETLNAEINSRLAAHDRAHRIELLNAGGVACGHINNLQEVFDEPQVQHLGLVKDVVSPHQGPQRLVGQPVQLERTPSTIARAAPRRGEHTAEVLAELGVSADELSGLKAQGVF